MCAVDELPKIHELVLDHQIQASAVILNIIRPVGLAVIVLVILGLCLHYLFTRLLVEPETEPLDRKQSGQELERYRKPTRILHWTHGSAFCILLLTGSATYLSPAGVLAQNTWLRFIHQIAAIIFVAAPFVYLPLNWRATLRGIKEAFIWGAEDVEWLIAIPRYYYLHEQTVLPPQEHLNAVQKLWWFVVIVFGPVLVISGAIMALGAASALFQWAVVFHDIAFVVIGSMFFLHIYFSVVHPSARTGRNESWSAMTRGKVSIEYAKSHHRRWYERMAKRLEK